MASRGGLLKHGVKRPQPPAGLPVNVSPPTFTGTTTEGQHLQIAPGVWSGAISSERTYALYRSGALISDATFTADLRYLLVYADAGHTLEVRETVSNTVGPANEDTLPTATILPLAPTIIQDVVITGPAVLAAVLTATRGSATRDPEQPTPLQWERDGVARAGETAATYTVVAGDIGAVMTCVETFANDGGSVESTSNSIGPILDPAPPPTEVTVRAGETQRLSLATILDGVPDNRITVEVTGSIPCRVWPRWELPTGSAQWFVKRELVDDTVGFLVVADDAIHGTTGTVTLTYKDGAGETGNTVQAVIELTAEVADRLTYDIGAKTLARHGGFPLAWLQGGGTWSIQSQSTANAFEVFGNYVPWKASGSPASNSYGTSKVITSPTVGSAAYTVTLVRAEDAEVRVITFNVVDHVYSVGPTPSTMTADNTNSQIRLALNAATFFGDQVVVNPGTYAESFTFAPTSGMARTQRPGGPAAPADPYDAGWVVLRSYEYHCAHVEAMTINCTGLANLYLRLTDIDMNPPVGDYGTAITWSGSPDAMAYCQQDHCSAQGLQFGSPRTSGNAQVFVTDNYLDCQAPVVCQVEVTTPNVSGVTLYGRDSQIIGNWIVNNNKDAIRHAIYNSTPGSGRSLISWNFVWNKRREDKVGADLHPDFSQAQIDTITAPLVVPSADPIEIATYYGNVFVRGVGSTNESDGADGYDGQLIFISDTSKMNVITRVVGNVLQAGLSNGITIRTPYTGCLVGENTMLPSLWIPDFDPQANMGGPNIRLEINITAGSFGVDFGRALLRRNVVGAGTSPVNDPADPVLDSNYFDFNQTVAATIFIQPGPGAVSNPQQPIDAFTPLSDATPLGPDDATRIGAIRSDIDFRRRTIDADLLTYPPAPLGRVQITGTPAVGEILTAVAPDYITAPTTEEWQWYANQGGVYVAIPAATTAAWEVDAAYAGLPILAEHVPGNAVHTYDVGDMAVISEEVLLSGTRAWLPTDIAGANVFWLESDDAQNVYAGNLVNSIKNKGALGPATVTPTLASPDGKTNTVNGLDVVTHNLNDQLQTAAQTWGGSSKLYFFATWKHDIAGGTAVLMRTSVWNNTTGVSFASTGIATRGAQPNDFIVAGDGFGVTGIYNSPFAYAQTPTCVTDQAWHVVVGGIPVLGSPFFRQDGTPQTLRNSSVTVAGNTAQNANLLIGSSSRMRWATLGYIQIAAEIAIADVQRLEGYMAWRAGLEGNLPAEHPYKNAAPTVTV